MALVECKVRPSLNAAINKKTDLMVTRKAVYAKIGHTEPLLGTALARHVADRLRPVRTELSGLQSGPLPGYRARIVDGIHILTNLPAEVHRGRWRIAGAFHELEAAIRGEAETLGYPQAALLAFCGALVAFDVLQVVKAAIGTGHGIDAGAEVSGSDVAEEVAGTRRGMGIASAPSVWSVFARMSPSELGGCLRGPGRCVWLSDYRK